MFGQFFTPTSKASDRRTQLVRISAKRANQCQNRTRDLHVHILPNQYRSSSPNRGESSLHNIKYGCCDSPQTRAKCSQRHTGFAYVMWLRASHYVPQAHPFPSSFQRQGIHTSACLKVINLLASFPNRRRNEATTCQIYC